MGREVGDAESEYLNLAKRVRNWLESTGASSSPSVTICLVMLEALS